MPATSTCGPIRDDRDLARFGEIASDAFASPPERARPYFESVGLENARGQWRNGVLAGGLVVLPMGQWFGGRAVPMVGIAAVAVAAEFRACGVATELLQATLQELHANGTPLSTLYPATFALYRRVGYEPAGHSYDVVMPVRSIDVRDRTLELRTAVADDEAAIRATYAAFAARNPGMLQRSEFIWRRVFEWRGQRPLCYVICRGTMVEGYAYLLTQPGEGPRSNLRVHDWAALTPEAGCRLLTLLADHRTTRERVSWRSGPADPLLAQLAEMTYTVTSQTPWMVRLVDIPAALAARGYAPGVTAELHLDVHGDDVLPQNNGRFVLHVADGRGRVEPGGRGSFHVHLRGLAALYTGYFSPMDLPLAGLAAGPESDLMRAEAVFSGPVPWMRDEF